MSMNWLEGTHQHMDGPGQPQAMAMPVFAGQKLVVVGGSSGMDARPPRTSWPPAAAPSSSARNPGWVEDTVQTLAKDGPAYGISADLADRDQVRTGPPATGRRARRRDSAGQRGGGVRPQAVPGPRRRRLRLLRRTTELGAGSRPGHTRRDARLVRRGPLHPPSALLRRIAAAGGSLT